MMTTPPVIVGFSSNDRVPGFYGETVYGAGAISAASIPLVLLLVGTKLSGGTATPNQDVVNVLSADDADAAFGAGAELSRMCYAALRVPGVTIKAAPVAEAGGAAAGVQVITISGTWTVAGTLSYRANGETVQQTVQSTDTTANVATNLAATFNQDARRPYSAAASGSQVILTSRSKGARQNAYITFQDTTLGPSGLVSRISGPAWTVGTGVTTSSPISFVVPTTANGFYYKCTTGGTTHATTEPTWPTTIGTTVTDNGVVWTCWGKVLNGGATTWGGGTGTEDVATLLTVITPTPYDRIACSENDATNLAKWLTFLNSQAGPLAGILEHMTTAVTDATQPTSLATSTLNAFRIGLMWMQNGESAPWEMSSYFAALRCATEQSDPDSAYDDVQLVGIAPQSQPGDRPSHSTKLSCINNGITIVYTDTSGGAARVCRAVTTHTLNGSTPDYRTLDVSDAYVPDFVRKDVGLFWTTVFKPNNPRVADDPAGDSKPLPAGIATPSVWNAYVEGKLRKYERGILANDSSPTQQTVAPIVINVDSNKPTSVYDPVAKRIMSVIPVVPAPNQHQIGVSVRNVTSA